MEFSHARPVGLIINTNITQVYLFFKSTDEFRETLALYAAAQSLATISEGKDREAYQNKANVHRKKLVKFLSENKNTCFDVTYVLPVGGISKGQKTTNCHAGLALRSYRKEKNTAIAEKSLKKS